MVDVPHVSQASQAPQGRDRKQGGWGKVVFSSRGVAERLLLFIEECFTFCKITADAIDAVVAVRGPGSFTGVRACLSAAHACALSASCPVHGVTTFDMLAWSYGESYGAQLEGDAVYPMRVMVPAVGDAIYGQEYRMHTSEAGVVSRLVSHGKVRHGTLHDECHARGDKKQGVSVIPSCVAASVPSMTHAYGVAPHAVHALRYCLCHGLCEDTRQEHTRASPQAFHVVEPFYGRGHYASA